ncbi:cytochrome P450 3A24-like [Physella acuta]|uniref:cytochrome P450 3A24-like n=1 Tax=Physella acuta TaxID=109671 RepID=UPI0027DD40FA|nr:cytochrome P450 3A24-like [Physella acuta]
MDEFNFELETAVGVLVAVVVSWFIYCWIFGKDSWDQYGVKQVSLGRLAFSDFRAISSALVAKHGDTVGLKFGRMVLVTRDLDLLRHVMSKDFNNFVDRMGVLTTTSVKEDGLFFTHAKNWKRIRHVMSPSFSTGKLKQACSNIEESAQKLATVLEEFARNQTLLPVKHITSQYTSEIIARSAFGLRTDCLGKDDDEFTYYAKNIFTVRSKLQDVMLQVVVRWKRLHVYLVKTLGISCLDIINKKTDKYFRTVLSPIVAQRIVMEKQGARKPTDLLQSLVAAKLAGDEEAATFKPDMTEHQTWEKLPKTLSERELLGQALLIIFAGFETTSMTLKMCLYLLAKHPDIQEKLYAEICSVVTSNSPTYEELSQLTYMEQVINETLRLFPPVLIINRTAAETRTYGHVTIPKNAVVMILIEEIMKDPRNYPDPERFDPDRFSPENSKHRDPMTFLPFGYGPRLCIGMRLAYLELKIGLVHVLRKVKVELNEKTVPPIGGDVITKFQFFIVVETPIQLEVKLRNKQK